MREFPILMLKGAIWMHVHLFNNFAVTFVGENWLLFCSLCSPSMAGLTSKKLILPPKIIKNVRAKLLKKCMYTNIPPFKIITRKPRIITIPQKMRGRGGAVEDMVQWHLRGWWIVHMELLIQHPWLFNVWGDPCPGVCCRSGGEWAQSSRWPSNMSKTDNALLPTLRWK